MALLLYAGTVRTILITEDGVRSVQQLADSHGKDAVEGLAKANALIRRLGDTGQLRSPDQFRQEGPGFFAIRAKCIRFYGWYEPNQTFVVSHAICKRHDKLAAGDVQRMQTNQKRYRGK